MNQHKCEIANVSSEYHNYTLDWGPDKIDMYVDTVKHYSYNRTANDGWVFDKPYYIILSLAIGGPAGTNIDNKAFPQKYIIDYIRIYEYMN